jgi:hypothetical protein
LCGNKVNVAGEELVHMGDSYVWVLKLFNMVDELSPQLTCRAAALGEGFESVKHAGAICRRDKGLKFA